MAGEAESRATRVRREPCRFARARLGPHARDQRRHRPSRLGRLFPTVADLGGARARVVIKRSKAARGALPDVHSCAAKAATVSTALRSAQSRSPGPPPRKIAHGELVRYLVGSKIVLRPARQDDDLRVEAGPAQDVAEPPEPLRIRLDELIVEDDGARSNEGSGKIPSDATAIHRLASGVGRTGGSPSVMAPRTAC